MRQPLLIAAAALLWNTFKVDARLEDKPKGPQVNRRALITPAELLRPSVEITTAAFQSRLTRIFAL